MGRARTFQMDKITLHKAINVRKINKRKEERKESRQADKPPKCLENNVGQKTGLMKLHGYRRVNDLTFNSK